jgi:aminocarboxymuconate-semialdehyde decarboxylase
MTEEWWPELAPRWEATTADKPSQLTVDIHNHLLVPASAEVAMPYFTPEKDPRSFFSSEESVRYNKESRAVVMDKFTLPEPRIADMDLMGIDMQAVAIAPPHYFYWLDEDVAPGVSAMQNERIAEVVAGNPDRFVGIATLPMKYPDAAVKELERAHRELGFNGFEVNADIDGEELDDRRFDPIWAKAEELGVLCILHPQGFTHGQRMSDYYLINVVCMPLASTLTVSRMILGGVWERYPDFKMLVVHGGGYLPFYSARTDHAFRHRPEMRRHIDRNKLPSDYLAKLYFDTTVFDPRMVEQLVENYGADHVLLGTDYPFDMGSTDPLGFISQARLTAAQRDLVVGGNAARLLGIGT